MHDKNLIDENQGWRHPYKIPAAGNGNSENGNFWINPTDEQLKRSCERKGKTLCHDDKTAVAAIHGEVIEKTWNAISEYENLHAYCLNPSLSRFYGKANQHSLKARWNHLKGYPYPFDRHDWIVNRCGKEVRYIIDYYGGDMDPTAPEKGKLVVDCRPAPTPEGISDRIKLAMIKSYINKY